MRSGSERLLVANMRLASRPVARLLASKRIEGIRDSNCRQEQTDACSRPELRSHTAKFYGAVTLKNDRATRPEPQACSPSSLRAEEGLKEVFRIFTSDSMSV